MQKPVFSLKTAYCFSWLAQSFRHRASFSWIVWVLPLNCQVCCQRESLLMANNRYWQGLTLATDIGRLVLSRRWSDCSFVAGFACNGRTFDFFDGLALRSFGTPLPTTRNSCEAESDVPTLLWRWWQPTYPEPAVQSTSWLKGFANRGGASEYANQREELQDCAVLHLAVPHFGWLSCEDFCISVNGLFTNSK